MTKTLARRISALEERKNRSKPILVSLSGIPERYLMETTRGWAERIGWGAALQCVDELRRVLSVR